MKHARMAVYELESQLIYRFYVIGFIPVIGRRLLVYVELEWCKYLCVQVVGKREVGIETARSGQVRRGHATTNT
ncbi:hypothetical protein CHH75_13960 [Paenibacillus sp. 7541]|uniref:Uncharacterized protein n=1 Tax=Paenibacillus campinasensis TaxID=66347 RepID=A0A268F1Y6_9BACL|nr:hypothetical protein CHH67_04040 [Paenibacillus campinasensis]PAK51670.1 hypothetical protein CHH75_13960 [Paenibacillus sp. 7541]